MFKKLLITLFVLLLLLAGGGAYLYTHLGLAVKLAIEYVGTRATRAGVHVGKVELSIPEGQGSITGLRIGSPSGFDAKQSLSLGSISIALDTASVRGVGPIIISKIEIDAPQVTYELTENGGSNLQALQRNTTNYANSFGGSTGTPTANGSSRKFIIDDLYIRSGRVSVSSTMLRGKGLNASLPAIHLHDIGKAKGGATPAEIAQQVVGAITSDATQVAALNFGGVLGSVKDLATSGLGSVGSNVGGAVSGVGSGVGKEVKGLFGN